MSLEDIPIELFTTDEIRKRWGNAEYGFAFSRQEETGARTPLGGWRKTTLSEPEEEAPHASRVPGTSIVPANGGAAFEGPMSLLLALRDLSRDEVNTQVAMVREQASSQTSMFLECLRVVQSARTPPAEGEALALMREELRETRRHMLAMQERFLERLDPEPEPDEPDEPSREDDEAKVKRLAGIVKRDGALAAVQQFLGDESAATFVRLLPRIKAMMPELARTIGPMLRDLLSDPPPPPAPAPPVQAAPAPPPPAPPRPPRRVRDEHTPKVQ